MKDGICAVIGFGVGVFLGCIFGNIIYGAGVGFVLSVVLLMAWGENNRSY